jgi:D-alanyl-D-alanine carboxypeptidase (penicillin-binding protein 5/6)
MMRRGRRLSLTVSLAAALLALASLGAAPAAARGPRLEARAWVLIDARDGAVLSSHAARRRLPIASATKLMTAWVALHELSLDRLVRAAPYRAEYGESLLGLRAGQRISVRDLLYGLVLRSGNDAAYELALAAAGSERRFVRRMNRSAARLGLTDTHYANPVGLDQPGNRSSALDLALLARRLLRVPVFARIAASRRAVLRSLRPRRRISTINELLRMAPWANGVKTGHTFQAGYVLVGSGRRGGVELISAVLGAESDEVRFAGSLRLLGWGFSRYRRRVAVHAGEVLADPSIRWSGGSLPLRAARSVALGVRRGQRLRVEVRAPKTVEGPIRRGAVLGRAVVLIDGARAAVVALRAGHAVATASALDRARSFAAANAILLLAALFGILVGAAFVWRLQRRGAKRENEMVIFEERRG